MRPIILAGVLAGLAAPAWAQTPAPPDRIGNTWNGHHHQPARAPVIAAERQAGVMPRPAVREQHADTLRKLDKQLLNREGVGR